jgi:acetate kinase
MKSILIINAGSSSLKFQLFHFDNLESYINGQISGLGTSDQKIIIKDNNKEVIHQEKYQATTSRDEILVSLVETLQKLFPSLKLEVAGHRVVHGGIHYINPTIINQTVIDTLKSITYLTPIHLPHNIKPMEVLQSKFPNLKQVACFDTAFHATNNKLTQYYAIPRKYIEQDNIKRYGFHGLSYEYLSLKIKEIDKDLSSKKIIAFHLGAGASLCALENGKSVTTTMGLTPLDGLIMGSRCGSIDGGIILYLLQHKKLTPKELEHVLYFESGILGLSEESSDFYQVETSKNPKAKEAWEIYLYNLLKQTGQMIAALEGVDGFIFTGGVGENTAELRSYLANKLKWLNIEIDESNNKNKEILISTPQSKVKFYVIPTNEEWIIANHSKNLIS